MRLSIQRVTLLASVMLGVLAVVPSTTQAQKALVYCPVSVDATGCNAIVTALSGGAFPLGVDRGFDGTGGTVDLKTVDLFTYSVFVVPSLADGATSQPYAKLRDPEVVEHLKAALIGRIALWSGSPDQGASNRTAKDALIQNLTAWAAGAFGTAKGPGLVGLLDGSSSYSARYDWLRGITPLPVTADANLLSYDAARALNSRGTTILTSGTGPIAYANLATYGFQVPNGAAGVSLDAVGQTGTSVGGQVVLLTVEAGNTTGAVVKTDKDDYAPGTPVVITGSGWQAGETVKLTLHMDPLRDADTELTAIADGNGSITNTEFAPKEYDIGVRFVLTAVGQASGRRAQTTFTDNTSIKTVTVLGGQTPSSFSPGGSATYGTTAATSVAVAFNGSGTCTVTLTAVGLPSGATATFAPSTLQGANQDVRNSLLTVNTTAAVATGNHTFKVRATGSAGDCGPPNPQFEESANVTLAIAAPSAVNTTTTVASSANPSVFGQSVTFTATVTASAGTPSGSVTFKDGAAALGTVNLANGQATVSTSALIVGSHSITVDYTGVAGSFNASTSAPLSQVVNQAQTTTTLASSLNPSTFGQPVTFTATVAAVSPGAGTPTGNVDFKEGATTLGAVPLSNIGGVQTATFTTSALVVGTHNVTATYAGATNFVTSTSTQVAQVINQIATTLAVDPATGAYGGTATLRATLKTGTTPLSGKAVAFSLNGTPAGTATTDASGVAILPNVSLAGVNAGTYSPGASSGVRAEFTADATLAGSFGTALLKVDPKALTITASDRTKAYGEAVTFAGTEFTATGVVSGDAVASVALSSVGAAATAAVAGSPYDITPSNAVGTGLTNYVITYAVGKLKVDPKALTITAAARTKVYGQTVTFAGTEFTTVGLLNGDGVSSVTLTSTGAPASASVSGSPYDIVASNAVGTGLTNYTIGYVNGKLTVGPRPLTITAKDANKIYGDPAVLDGASGFTTSTGDLVNGDVVSSVTLMSPGAVATATVASYDIVASAAVGTGLLNYTVTYQKGKLNVSPRPLTVTANDRTKTYGEMVTFAGNEFSTGSGQLVNEDVVNSVTLTSAGAPGAALVGGSPYAIAASAAVGTGLDNYAIDYAAGKLTVKPRTLTITAKDLAKIYGDVATLDGASGFTTGTGDLVNGDAVNGVTLTSAGTLGTAAVGNYDIIASAASGAALANYVISYVKGNLKVDPRPLTITAKDASKVYGDAATLDGAVGFTTGAGQLVNNDVVNSVTLASPGAGVTALVAGSPYDIVASVAVGTGLTNYAIGYVPGKLTVNHRTLTITAKDAGKTYGDVAVLDGAAGFTTIAGQLVNGDAVTGVTLTSAGAAATALVSGSPFAIAPSAAAGTGLANYAVGYVDGKLTVNARALTITAKNATKTYGQALVLDGATGFSTGSGQLVNGDVVASVTLTSAGTPAAAAVAGSPYDIIPTAAVGGALANYNIAYVNGKLSVTKATPAIVWNGMPSSVDQGSQLTAAQLNAIAQPVIAGPAVAGTFVYTLLPSTTVTVGTPVFGAGLYDIRVDFVSSDQNYAGTSLTKVLTVNNVAPTVTSITLPTTAISLGSAANLTAKFIDPGLTDTHTFSVDWDWDLATNAKAPGSFTSAFSTVASEPTSSVQGMVSGGNTYQAAGVYTVRVTVRDNNAGTGSRTSQSETFAYIVVYDPSGGFVTGGGWINSPSGACQLSQTCGGAVGKANFGFVAKYKRGQTAPDGNTEFQFQAGNLNFSSTSYDWLVVAGTKAQYKGVGTINGGGRYGFILTAVDGDTKGAPDTFRMKIVIKNTDGTDGATVYDNQMGAPDDGTPTTMLGGGSIQIHDK